MRRPRPLALAIVGAALALPSVAHAAIVTNGDFETGNLTGWHEDYVQSPGPSQWFVYTGTTVPLSGNPVPSPPQGTHAAITDQSGSSRQILFQDLTLPVGGSVNQLSLIGYYNSDVAIASPDTLSLSTVPNQQYRIDVIRPGAAIDSVAPGDVLLNVFRTRTGDPLALAPTPVIANLSAFAGQTVRLRFAVTVNQNQLNGGVDAVSVKSNGFSIGTATRNKKKGSALVPLTLPDAGHVTVSGNGLKGRVAAASKSAAVGAGTVNLLIKAKGKKRRTLNETGKVKLNVAVTYTPTGGSANTRSVNVKLKKKL